MTQPINEDNRKLEPDLTAEEVAHVLRVTSRIVRMWADQRKIPADLFYRLPGDTHYRFKPEIIDWLRNRNIERHV